MVYIQFIVKTLVQSSIVVKIGWVEVKSIKKKLFVLFKAIKD